MALDERQLASPQPVGRVGWLRLANRHCLRLWRDDSGVVLALSVIAFLILFVMATAGYAVGETVRQRIEIQNAADAAAYSGAIVQADTLARLAAINRAMSWTYVMLVRMEMDAIVDKWLELVEDQWDRDENTIKLYNLTSCNQMRPVALWNGISLAQDKEVLLNGYHIVKMLTINTTRDAAAAQGKSHKKLKDKIEKARQNIQAMNEAQEDLVKQMKGRIEATVAEVVAANVAETFNDQDAGGAAIKHVCLLGDNYFRILRNTQAEEKEFLAHSGFVDDPQTIFGKGIDRWFVRSGSGEGLGREYRQAGTTLLANWQWYSSHWVPAGVAGCVFDSMISGTSQVTGQQGYDAGFYQTGTAKPHVLTESFFGKDGAIVVGLRRQLNNPLAYLFAGNEPGIFKAFTVPGTSRFMWTAAAARAGYQSPREPGPGHYETTFEKVDIDKLWNLKTSDWDAVLLPLHRAWADGRDGRAWSDFTAGQVLQQVQANLGVGNLAAPPGMTGGTLNTSGLDGWVMH